MAPRGVVEHLDVVEHVAACGLAIDVDSATDALTLEELEEALGDGVVVAVTAAAHAGLEIVFLQEGLPVVAGQLAAVDALYVSSSKLRLTDLAPAA